jgi:hypothetical protein
MFRSDAELRALFEVERTFSWAARASPNCDIGRKNLL